MARVRARARFHLVKDLVQVKGSAPCMQLSETGWHTNSVSMLGLGEAFELPHAVACARGLDGV